MILFVPVRAAAQGHRFLTGASKGGAQGAVPGHAGYSLGSQVLGGVGSSLRVCGAVLGTHGVAAVGQSEQALSPGGPGCESLFCC